MHVGCRMHARRNFFEAKDSDPVRAHEALAPIRLLYAVEAEAKAKGLSGTDLAAYRHERAGPRCSPLPIGWPTRCRAPCPRARPARRPARRRTSGQC
jgi:hypothetical protein